MADAPLYIGRWNPKKAKTGFSKRHPLMHLSIVGFQWNFVCIQGYIQGLTPPSFTLLARCVQYLGWTIPSPQYCLVYSKGVSSIVLRIIFDRNIVETCGFHQSAAETYRHLSVEKSHWYLTCQIDYACRQLSNKHKHSEHIAVQPYMEVVGNRFTSHIQGKFVDDRECAVESRVLIANLKIWQSLVRWDRWKVEWK